MPDFIYIEVVGRTGTEYSQPSVGLCGSCIMPSGMASRLQFNIHFGLWTALIFSDI